MWQIVPATSATGILNPGCGSETASFDVASNVYQVHCSPCFLTSCLNNSFHTFNGIQCRGEQYLEGPTDSSTRQVLVVAWTEGPAA
jgi:hypothetical protein